MNKRMLLPAILISLTLPTLLSSCSVFWGPDKQFNNQMTGALEIAQDIIGNEKESKPCESKPTKEKLACQKQVDTLVQSIRKANKSDNNEQK